MKLLTKTTVYYLISAFVIVLLSSGIQYFYVHSKVIKRVDNAIQKEKELLVKQLGNLKNKDNFELYKTEESEITISDIGKETKDSFTIKEVYDSLEGGYIQYRVLSGVVEINHVFYDLRISKPLLEAQGFIQNIMINLITTFGLFLIVFVIVNRWILKKLWSPFTETLRILKEYDISRGHLIKFGTSDIREFNDLNKELNHMTKKIFDDYQGQKQFVENASHEFQTPLAVIGANAEILMQSENLNENDMHHLGAIIETLGKLSKLNQELILLSKIEYHQFTTKEEVDFKSILDKSMHNFRALIKNKNLSVSKNYEAHQTILMNETLAEVLINNLIKNAVIHNVQGGIIEIKLDADGIIIANSGQPMKVDPEKLFDRFQKGSRSKSSTGLGLAIIRQICIANNFDLEYTVEGKYHIMHISFKAKET